MKTITKKELVNRIAEKTGVTKVVAKDVIQSFLDAIIDELAEGNRLEFREFGVFESKERAARRAQNPRTLEKVSVPAKRIVKFKVGRLMRKRVSGEDVPDELDDASDLEDLGVDEMQEMARRRGDGRADGKAAPLPMRSRTAADQING